MAAGRKWSEEKRAEALTMLRDGVGTQETARRTGIGAATLSKWAKVEGIVSPNAEQTANAHEAVKQSWVRRRGELVDRMGDVAAKLLEQIAVDTDAADQRQRSIALAVLVDKAQLVSGSATSRHEVLDAQRRRERVERMQDELAERRAAKDGTTGG